MAQWTPEDTTTNEHPLGPDLARFRPPCALTWPKSLGVLTRRGLVTAQLGATKRRAHREPDSALVSRQSGRRWSLEEVKAYLGHASITTTERYARFAGGALMDAARETARAGEARATGDGAKGEANNEEAGR